MMAWVYIAVSDVLLAFIFYMIGKKSGRSRALFEFAVTTKMALNEEEQDYFKNKLNDFYQKTLKKE